MKSDSLEYNAWFYWNILIPKYWKTTGIDGTAWENGKKPKGKFNLKESVIVIVITSEIAKGNLIYGRGICKTPERCTWNKTY